MRPLHYCARLLYLSLALWLWATAGHGQNRVGIGGWQLHIPYTEGRAVADTGDKVYLAADQGLFYYDKEFRNVKPITRADGLREQRISTIGYDSDTRTLVIAYANANIDLLQGNQITNIPYILRNTFPGSKTIQNVLIHQKTAYLSTGFGIVALDLARREIKDTYTNLGPNGQVLPVISTAIVGDSIFLATGNGIWAANRQTSNLKDFRSWHRRNVGLPAGMEVTAMAASNSKVYVGTASGLFVRQNGVWEQVQLPVSSVVRSLRASATHVAGALEDGVLLLDQANHVQIVKGESLDQVRDAVFDGTQLWVAHPAKGLVSRGLQSNEATAYAPSGPASGKGFRAHAEGGAVYVMSGGYSDSYQPLGQTDGYYTYQNGSWQSSQGVSPDTNGPFRDFVGATVNPVTGYIYTATYGNGLLAWKGSETPVIYNGTNSTLLSTKPSEDRTEQVRLTDVSADPDGNVWVVNRHQVAGAPGLHVLRPDGEWQGFTIAGIADNGNLERLTLDDNNYKWLSISRNGNVRSGLVVYDEIRQQVRQLGVGAGNGNLPTGAVYTLAKDLSGDIWVGTSSGVAVYYNTAAVFGTHAFDARIPILEGRPLLTGQLVRDIAVDGANRKWVATDNGLWLINPEGSALLQHFTTENSPLPSNRVLSVAIEHRAGEVFVVTDAGIASYRAGATITEGRPDCAEVYPNPVRPNYTGLIGVSGLPNNAHVRITDVSGTLVHRTRATGGTLTWDARGYNGKRVKAGVYLVLSSDEQGKQTCISKIAVLE